MGEIHEVVDRVCGRYLQLVDAAMPGRIDGLFLVGSVAYDDFWAGGSDVDFVAVANDGFDERDRSTLQSVHATLAAEFEQPHLDGHYRARRELHVHPDLLDEAPVANEGRVGFGRPSPIEWGTLARSHAIRGVVPTAVWQDPAAIREYSRRNLTEYWRDRWLSSQKRPTGGRQSLIDWGIHWGVLGLPRLHYSILTGEVISKSASGEYALETFGADWERIVREALRIRRHESTKSLYRTRLGRRRDALAFQEHVIAEGLRLP